MRAHNDRRKGLPVKIIGFVRLSEKCTEGVKERVKRSECEGDASLIARPEKRRDNASHLGPHLLWITL